MPKSFKLEVGSVVAEVRAARDEALARYERDRDGYNDAVEAWKLDARKVLERALRAVDRGEVPNKSRYSGTSVTIPERPERPKKANYIGGFERVLRYLSRINTTTVTADQQTYERWTGGWSA